MYVKFIFMGMFVSRQCEVLMRLHRDRNSSRQNTKLVKVADEGDDHSLFSVVVTSQQVIEQNTKNNRLEMSLIFLKKILICYAILHYYGKEMKTLHP